MQHLWGFAGSFVGGLVLGVVITIFAPRFMGPYLPANMGGGIDGIEGKVATKQKEADRLILTIHTAEGAILATFKEKITEIDILVATGDSITLARKNYKAFLENPGIGRVRKKEPPRQSTSGTPPPPGPTEPNIKEQVLQ